MRQKASRIHPTPAVFFVEFPTQPQDSFSPPWILILFPERAKWVESDCKKIRISHPSFHPSKLASWAGLVPLSNIQFRIYKHKSCQKPVLAMHSRHHV